MVRPCEGRTGSWGRTCVFSPVGVSGFRKPFLPEVVEKIREAILGCVHAFEVHSPLEGESVS